MYFDLVVGLDFVSLYFSIMWVYNLCYLIIIIIDEVLEYVRKNNILYYIIKWYDEDLGKMKIYRFV